jgi:CubicO group peptidase (beta-lactamase class C family)
VLILLEIRRVKAAIWIFSFGEGSMFDRSKSAWPVRLGVGWVVLLALACGVGPVLDRTLAQDKGVRQRIAAVESGLISKAAQARRETIVERMRQLNVPGVSVAVIHGYKLDWARGYGVADRQTGAPVTNQTLFQAASVSKPVAALGTLRLVERGLLNLDRDVNRDLKSWKVPENQFTRQHAVDLRSLLSHTAGTTVHGFGGYPAGARLPTLRQILDGVKPANSAPVRVDKVPGHGFRYSGGGIEIEQRLAMDVTSKAFPELMRNLVLGPLEMSSSTYQQPLPRDLWTRAAAAHDDKGRVIQGKWHVYPEMAAAGLWTTPADMSRYVIEVLLASEGRSQKVLRRDMVQQMLTPQNGGPAGLGPFIEMRRDGKRFSHNGANEGFRCAFVGLLKRGDGAVVMTNSDNGDPLIGEIMKSIAGVYGWD